MTTANTDLQPDPSATEEEVQLATPERLAWALDFDEDDLQANRQGKLSEMQNYRLRLRRQRAILIGLVIIFLFVLSATGLLFLGRTQDSAILTILGIGVTLGNAAMTGIFARYWLRINADIRQGNVRAITGTLERVVKPVTRRVVNMLVRVDDYETIVTKEAFDSFAHLQPYTLYVTSYTGALLSAESVE